MVRSTFLSHCPLPSNHLHWLTSAVSIYFGNAGIWTCGWKYWTNDWSMFYKSMYKQATDTLSQINVKWKILLKIARIFWSHIFQSNAILYSCPSLFLSPDQKHSLTLSTLFSIHSHTHIHTPTHPHTHIDTTFSNTHSIRPLNSICVYVHCTHSIRNAHTLSFSESLSEVFITLKEKKLRQVIWDQTCIKTSLFLVKLLNCFEKFFASKTFFILATLFYKTSLPFSFSGGESQAQDPAAAAGFDGERTVYACNGSPLVLKCHNTNKTRGIIKVTR